MSQINTRRGRLCVPLILAVLVAACGGEAGEGGAEVDTLTLAFSSPADGAEVGETVTLEFDASVPLGDPSTGNHHVHLCVDSEDCATESEYSLVYDNTFELTGLTQGEHTLGASLRNADHSDAGPSDEITVTVAGNGATTDDRGETDDATDTTTGSGFDY